MVRKSALIFLTVLLAASALAQQSIMVTDRAPHRWDLAAGYTVTRANAPPGSCGCFSMNGGFAAGDFNFNPWFGVTGKFTGNGTSQIGSLGQGLTLMTFAGGPRVSWQRVLSPRFYFTPFADFLVGGAHGGNSYFPNGTTSATGASSFSYSAGGGLDVPVSQRFSIRAFDASYLHTGFPNGSGNGQSHLQIGVGLVILFGAE